MYAVKGGSVKMAMYDKVYGHEGGFWWIKREHPYFKRMGKSIIHIENCVLSGIPPHEWRILRGDSYLDANKHNCDCENMESGGIEIDPVAKLKHFQDIYGDRYGF